MMDRGADVCKKSGRPSLKLGVYGVVPTDTLSEVCIDLDDGQTLLVSQAKVSISLGGWVRIIPRYLILQGRTDHVNCVLMHLMDDIVIGKDFLFNNHYRFNILTL